MENFAEVKKLVDDLGKSVHDMREANEQKMAELAKNNGVAELKEAQAKLDAQVADAIKGLTDLQRQQALGGNEPKGQLSKAEQEQKQVLDKLIRCKGDLERLTDVERKALSTLSNPDGGWLTSADTSGRIITKVRDMSPLRRYANVKNTSKGILTGIVNNGRNSYAWVGETETRAETNTKQFGEYEIRLHELYAYPKVSNTMLDDADYDIESLMIQDGSMGFAEGEADAFINGNGVKKPRGIMSQTFAYTGDNARAWGSVQKIKTGVNGGFATTGQANKLLDMACGLRAIYQANAVWGMNRFTLAEVMKLQDDTGNYIFLQGFNLQTGAFGTLLGHPVDASFDHMADIATDSLSIIYGDLGAAYQIADRRGISIVRDNITTPGQTKWNMSKRVGGDVVNFEAYRALEFKA